DVEVVLGQQHPILHKGNQMEDYDCVIIKGSFRYAAIAHSISKILAKTTYMPIQADSFNIVHDKILTHVQLQSHGIDMPKTYLSSSVAGAKELLKLVNYPIVMKFPHGTQVKGVMFADSYAAASSLLDALDS